MPKRHLKPAKAEQEEQPAWEQLRQWRLANACAVYARQSTTRQTIENRESSEAQTMDQLEKVRALGWKDGDITIFIEGDGKRGVSGRLRIDERPGLNALMEGIYNGTFKTIFTWNEARLFRDEFMIGPDTFIKACHDHDVQVVTWTYRYDFKRNPYDMDQVRMQCQIAARFVKDHIGYMHKMKERVMQRGQYFGGCVAIGYTVNDAGYLDPYEPHAEIVRWIFKRYRECGNVRQVGRELHAKGYAFPFFEPGVKVPHLRLKKQSGGYIIAHGGLLTMLTNVVYIGYWTVRRQVLRDKEGRPVVNHPPIVDEEDFWYAFNRLSPTTIDGETNEQREATVRYEQDGKVPSQALLKYVIKSVDAPVYTVKAAWNGSTWEQYCIRATEDPNYSYAKITHTTTFDIALLDAEFVRRMFEHLEAWKQQRELKGETTSLGEAIHQQLQEEEGKEKQGNPVQAIDEQLEQLKPKIAHYKRLIDKGFGLPDEELTEYGVKLAELYKAQ